MTDRELLELAAKAAGMTGLMWHESAECMFVTVSHPLCGKVEQFWNPLNEDRHAFRLAVYLSINIQIAAKEAGIVAATAPGGERMIERTMGLGDAAAATRRAITRAAAEIGKQK